MGVHDYDDVRLLGKFVQALLLTYLSNFLVVDRLHTLLENRKDFGWRSTSRRSQSFVEIRQYRQNLSPFPHLRNLHRLRLRASEHLYDFTGTSAYDMLFQYTS